VLIPILAFSETAPDVLAGSTAVEFLTSGSDVVFRGVGVEYRYRPSLGGSLAALSARFQGSEREFTPSYYGGIAADLGGAIRTPWSAEGQQGLAYELESLTRNGDTVHAVWKMIWRRDSCEYRFSFHLQGQVLVLDIEGDETGKAAGIGLNRAYPSENTRVVRVPFLALSNVLYREDSGCFVSFYADWERTNASSVEAWTDRTRRSTGYYAQRLGYAKRTDGRRNKVSERLYLSVAKNLINVLPNIDGPSAPRREQLASKIVLSYGRFFPWLLSAPRGADPTPHYLDSLTRLGVKDLAIILKDWNNGQFDHAYPCTWPPDDYRRSACWSARVAGVSEGGAAGLRRVREAVRSRGFAFGLHENYTDYHASECSLSNRLGPGEYRGLLPDGTPARTFHFDCRDAPSQAWLLKPSLLERVVPWSVGQIIAGLGGSPAVDFSYLDVSSAVNPSGPVSYDPSRSYVDFDATVGGSGRFQGTLQAYRTLPATVRELYQAPVQGEGTFHMLYAGYYDDLEGRLVTADDRFRGVRVPLLLDFALRKLHGKSSYHGLGHIQWFFAEQASRPAERITEDQVLAYVGTELAFGHGGLVTKAVLPDYDHSLMHAAVEQRLALPVQKAIVLSTVDRIVYDDDGEEVDASTFIVRHPDDFDDVTSDYFMGRVVVAYQNGVTVWVNRSQRPWDVTLPRPLGPWYSYHAIVDGVLAADAGSLSAAVVTLPPLSGWLCALPSVPQ